MKNLEVAQLLNEIANLLEIKGVQFKPIAYRRAAETVNSLSKPIENLNENELVELPGIGKSIAKKIVVMSKTGTLPYLEDLKKDCPIDYESLLAVEGVGPKTVKLLYQSLGVKDLDDLESMARQHEIRKLPGMKEKSEEKILSNIKFAKKSIRNLLGYILPLANELKNSLSELDEVIEVEIAGSIRRRKETIGDIDILVITDHPSEVMDSFTNFDNVDRIILKGSNKSTVRLKENVSCDLRVLPEKSFGSALMYFTGSKETNVELRRIAIKNELKLNEYGLFRGEEWVSGVTEQEVFRELGMDYIEPELRENRGEVEAALIGKLPALIGYDEIKGDLQMHSKWSDGSNSLEEMAMEAQSMGYEYIAFTDHTESLRIAGGMDENHINLQLKKLEKLNEDIDDLTILKGLEVNIDSDGKLDVTDEILMDLDVVIASIHSGFRQSRGKLTGRIISAMENEYVNIIAHPTGRKIHQRRAYELDFDEIFDKSVETNTYLEVNSQPDRLDLKDVYVKRALEAGCRLVIDTDAHNCGSLSNIEFGIATARRGWAEKNDIINTNSLKKFVKLLK